MATHLALSVRDLTVRFRLEDGTTAPVVRDVDLDVARGESVGVLGESGAGKSSLCHAILGILPRGGSVAAGRVMFGGEDLLTLDARSLRELRGKRLTMVSQEPGTALSPCLRVGTQIGDVVRAHESASRVEIRSRVLSMLERVQIGDPERVYHSYPHQLSGGQQQRAVIAQALIYEPELVIADEPTAALDATTQRDLISMLARLKHELGMGLLFVTHDPSLLAALSDRVAVMYAARIVEIGDRDEVLRRPLHPYTRDLLRCMPPPEPSPEGARAPLRVIPGSAPSRADSEPGCPFEPRCSDRFDECSNGLPPFFTPSPSRRAACIKVREPVA